MEKQDWISPWPERRANRTACERAKIADDAAGHLPKPEGVVDVSDDDLDAMKAAFMRRFDEELSRTETLMCVANIGYRMALRDIAARKSLTA